MNFIALDVETANADMSSICSLGLVHFKDGEVFKDLSTLIDPEDHFDPVNISVHGIKPEDVIGKPTIRAAYPALLENLANCIVVHHTHFDRTAFRQIAAKLSQSELPCHWLDSARMARRAWERFSQSGFGLKNLAAEFQIEFQHHQPSEDARCAGMVALRAIKDTGIPIDQWCELLEQVEHSPRIKMAGDPSGPLFGEIIAFTGKLTIERAEAAAMAAAVVCEVCAGVTKRTTILVVGDQDIRLLNGHDRSAKHRKAEQLIAAGASIRILCETDFRALIA
jgi:DNA polymerase III subunit epsilon